MLDPTLLLIQKKIKKGPSLRNASYGAANRNGACTIEEMKAGEWGIEHRSLPANDVNAVTFNLII